MRNSAGAQKPRSCALTRRILASVERFVERAADDAGIGFLGVTNLAASCRCFFVQMLRRNIRRSNFFEWEKLRLPGLVTSLLRRVVFVGAPTQGGLPLRQNGFADVAAPAIVGHFVDAGRAGTDARKHHRRAALDAPWACARRNWIGYDCCGCCEHTCLHAV